MCPPAADYLCVAGSHNLRDEFALAQQRRGVLPSSISKRDSCLRLFADWLEPDITDATSDQIDRFLDSRTGRNGGPISDRTRYAWISHLHAFYTWAIRHGHTDADPTLTIDRPRLRQTVPRPISEHDLTHAIRNADRTMKAWLTLMAFAGLRCAEVAGLVRDDLIDHESLIRVVGKGRKERLVPLHPCVESAVRSAGLPRQGRIFTHDDGTPWTPSQVSRAVRSHLDNLGIDASAHQLRHRFGTRAYEASKDIRVVSELMGHSSITTTQGYVAWSQTEARSAVAGLPLA